MIDALDELVQSPALYPMALDSARDALLFLRLSETDYRESSFLDERASITDRQEQWLSFAQIERAMVASAATRPLHFIFHMGHVGSTLLSRLLDEAGAIHPLREPLPLRTIAEAYDLGVADIDRRLETMLRLWERGFADTEAVVLKATSTTQRLAPRLLTMRPEARAVLLGVSAESYLATMFAAPNSAIDLNMNGPERMHRLATMGVTVPRPTTLGELAAMSWLAERVTQARIQRDFGTRALSIDFDAMLSSLEETLQRVLAHFRILRSPQIAASMAKSRVLSRYSKEQDRQYSAGLRTELLAEARAQYSQEIRTALEWLEAVAGRHPGSAALW
jgi:hypothetical protein